MVKETPDNGNHGRISLNNFEPPSGYRPGSGHHGHQTSFSTTRTTNHRGLKIKIRTTYRIEIDGKPLTTHTLVLNDGQVHCHGLPNYSFPSAIDLAKAIIDTSRYVKITDNELGQSEGNDGTNDGHGGHT